MVTQTRYALQMREFVGGANHINRKELAAFMGYRDPKSVDRYLDPLRKTGNRYLIEDVTEEIFRRMSWN